MNPYPLVHEGVLSSLLVCHSPSREPLQMLPLLIRSLHTKAESPEEPEEAEHHAVKRDEKAPLHCRTEVSCVPVQTKSAAENGEV